MHDLEGEGHGVAPPCTCSHELNKGNDLEFQGHAIEIENFKPSPSDSLTPKNYP